MDEQNNVMGASPEGSKGSLIGSIIVVLILIIGAVYLLRQPGTSVAPTEDTTPAPSDTQVVTTPSNSFTTLEAGAEASTTLPQ